MKDSPASNSSADKPPVREIHSPGDAILDFHEAAAFLGVSTKTFAKVLRTEDLPGRKVGREWKFSKAALLAWVGSGHTRDFKDEAEEDETELPIRTEIPRPAPAKSPAAPSPRPRASTRDSFSVDDD
jgi:excisionase family DNA binding protein